MLRAIFLLFVAIVSLAIGWWLWAGRPDFETVWAQRPSFISPDDGAPPPVPPAQMDPTRPVARPSADPVPGGAPYVVEDLDDPLDRAISGQIYLAETAFAERQRREARAAARDTLRRALKRDPLNRDELRAAAQSLGADPQVLDEIAKIPTTQDGRDRLVRLLETLI